MKKLWLLSPLALSMSLFGQEALSENNEVAKRPLLGYAQKKATTCESCCTPAVDYRLSGGCWGIDTSMEYLIWQVHEQATNFIATDSQINQTAEELNSLVSGKVRPQNFNWASGVRLGFGYSFGRDVWQLKGQYTWYRTTGQRSYSKPGALQNGSGDPIATQYQTPLLFGPESLGAKKATGSAAFTYQIADLLLTSAWLATDHLEFDYTLGTTGGYIKENLNVTYNASTGADTPNDVYNKNSWYFAGGGFRAGIESKWHMGWGLGFFGKLSFAAMLGQYTSDTVITMDGPYEDVGSQVQNSTYQGIMLLPTSQFMLGFDWTRTFSNCWIRQVRVSAAGEFNHLSDLQQTFVTADTSNRFQTKPTLRNVGSVYMYGATASLGMDY